VLAHRPTSVEECDERLDRVRQARRECSTAETELRRSYDDMIEELIACRVALIPSPRREP
jgi:hypothetical protein